MNNNYENKILDAIQTLVDSAVSNAGYDKTIRATISKCVNQNTGKYVVKYQDSSFYAYSSDLDAVYTGGTPVYVLVPGNDMSQTKTILGTVDKLGTEYISLSETSAAYQEVGTSLITPGYESAPGVSSYKSGGDSYVIYDRTAQYSDVILDIEGANLYFQNANYIEIGGTFTTQLNEEQKRKGNYGLVFDIDFKNGEEIVNRKYVIDINSMTGNPYSYNFGSKQTAIFEIDGEHFYRVNTITLECKNFPKSAASYEEDIFVSDIILKALVPLTRDEIANNSLTFITKQGIYFNENDTSSATRLIETEVKINQKVIENTNNILRYYWFKEDSTIGITSPDYSPFGGPGWKCLNQYNVIDETNNIRDYLTDADSLTVVKSGNPAKENEYKCVVIYNNEIQVERNITIFNQTSAYTVTIESDQGNYFKYNEGHPTLTCNVETTGTAPTYTYTWTVTDSTNRTNILEETTDLNTAYNALIAQRASLIADKTSGVWTEAKETQLAELEVEIYNFENNVMRVEGNKIYNIQLGSIANFNKYTCCVSSSGNFLGKSNIIITNSWDKEDNNYALIIENGDQIFKYNVNGIAPTNQSLEKPIVIKPLQFSLYNEIGQQVEDNKIAAVDVSWYVPKENTMVTVNPPQGVTPVEEDGYLVYTTLKTLDFSIAPIYNNKKMNNTIKLVVRYNDRVLTTTSELGFIKEGEVGSNGSNYVCRLAPNVAANAQIPAYPIYTYNTATSSGAMNYTLAASDKWFKVQLYKDGVEIFNGVTSGNSQENKPVTIAWSMLKNKYSNTVSDDSSFSVNASSGAFSYTNLQDAVLDRACNIARAEVTYDGATYYATMPIILVKTTSATYKASLAENTGFRYAMYTTDGLNPVYDSSNPFALKIIQVVDNVEQDVSVATAAASAVDYNWYVLGSIYSDDSWIDDTNLIARTHTTSNPLARNEADYMPVEKFNGLSVNNALKCIVKRNNTELIRIYLPIHLYLNRYGNAALNGWDGNHVEINTNGGFILAPQVGAGKKETDNSYTGVFMGTVREAGSSTEEVGLFGYNHGVRTIELDAEEGSAKFGRAGQGQIIISPDETSAHSVIKSGNYVAPVLDVHGNIITPGQGLEIDLTDPHITFGTGNFRVDSNGQVAATGFVTTARLEAGDYDIPGTENFKVINATDTAQFEADSDLYPSSTTTQTITCQCSYKDSLTSGYTITLVDSSGTPITNGSVINGISATVAKVASSQDSTITFGVNSSRQITGATNTFYAKFTYTASNLSILKAFHVNLVVLGADGATGQQGPQGPAGADGKDGKDGKDGTSVTVKGSYPTEQDLLAAFTPASQATEPDLGDGYVVDLDLYVYTGGAGGYGSLAGDWNDVGQFKGDDGAPGQDGQDGAPGQDASSVHIDSSSTVFKSTTGATGTFEPQYIYLYPRFQTVTYSKWQYSTNGTSWSDVSSGSNGLTIGTYNSVANSLRIERTSNLYTNSNTSVSFKCVSSNANYSDTVSIVKLYDVTDINVGGRNYILDSDTFTSAGSVDTTSGTIHPSIEEGLWKIVVDSTTNSNWHSWSHDNIIEDNFETNEDFIFSFEIRSANATNTTPPKIYFKNGMGYYSTIGSVDSNWSRCYYKGKWNDTNTIAFHFGWSGLAGTYYIRKLKFEKGNQPTDWTQAPEDFSSSIEEINAESTLITYAITENAEAPDESATWELSLPITIDKFIWQRTEFRFLDETRNYESEPTCIYAPPRISNNLQYCLCSTQIFNSSNITNPWQAEPFPWGDDCYSSTSIGDITILKYQFVRNVYKDTNKPDAESETYTDPILDQSWYMFGKKIAAETIARQALEGNINNNIVTINGQNGVTIKSANEEYGIRLTSAGLQFLLNDTWSTVWNINGTLDANLITVKDLRADNILSGTLTLNTTDNNGSFILNSSYGESSKIDGSGIKVTNADGSVIHLKATAGDGISAKTNTNIEYFKTDPDTQETTMKNAVVENSLDLGKIKVTLLTNGIAFIGV